MEPSELAEQMVQSALDKKAEDVVVVDVRGRVSYADYLVIASGTSDRHVQSIAESVSQDISKGGGRVLSREGLREGQWALVDAGDVVLHVFHPFMRSEVDLDSLWTHAPTRHVA